MKKFQYKFAALGEQKYLDLSAILENEVEIIFQSTAKVPITVYIPPSAENISLVNNSAARVEINLHTIETIESPPFDLYSENIDNICGPALEKCRKIYSINSQINLRDCGLLAALTLVNYPGTIIECGSTELKAAEILFDDEEAAKKNNVIVCKLPNAEIATNFPKKLIASRIIWV